MHVYTLYNRLVGRIQVIDLMRCISLTTVVLDIYNYRDDHGLSPIITVHIWKISVSAFYIVRVWWEVLGGQRDIHVQAVLSRCYRVVVW